MAASTRLPPAAPYNDNTYIMSKHYEDCPSKYDPLFESQLYQEEPKTREYDGAAPGMVSCACAAPAAAAGHAAAGGNIFRAPCYSPYQVANADEDDAYNNYGSLVLRCDEGGAMEWDDLDTGSATPEPCTPHAADAGSCCYE